MLQITVKTLDSQNHTFSCEDDITVQGFKEHITETVEIPAESQRLIFCGRVLQDDKKLTDYGDVDGKVLHLVQRAPPQPESRNGGSNGQRQNNQNFAHPSTRVQYRGQLHRNAMLLSAVTTVPPEVIEGHGIPPPQLSNTLSNDRLVAAGRFLNKARQLANCLDDPSAPLHSSPTENNASESSREGDQELDNNVNSYVHNDRNQTTQGILNPAAAFSASALINIRLINDDSDDRDDGDNLVDPLMQTNQSEQAHDSQAQTSETSTSQRTDSEESERFEQERAESEIPNSSQSNDEDTDTRRQSIPVIPRPPQMAELLDRLVTTQDRLRPHIERYRVLMSADPCLTPGTGPEGVTENQRIVDGVSESLHYLSHACHALSDIIVDMGQQPPRDLRCRPIRVRPSAIFQTGIPVQVESQFTLSNRNTSNNNNGTEEGNEATRPSSPTLGTADQANRSTSANNQQPTAQSDNVHQNQSSVLGTLLSLPNIVDYQVSMELSPQSTMDSNSPSAMDGSESEQARSNNNNGNVRGASAFSMAPPLAFIREAIQSVLSERVSQTTNGTTVNTPTIPTFVTIVGGQVMGDIVTPNSGQSTQARSNIGTHPTTSTQTRSTARPHVLHPHAHPFNVGINLGQSYEFDCFLPCNSHHVRRSQPISSPSTATSQTTTQPSTSENQNRSQSATQTSSTPGRSMPQAHSVNFTIGDANIARDLFDGDNQALATGMGLAMSLSEALQAGPASGDVYISLIGNGLNPGELHQMTPNGNLPLAELLRSFNFRLEEFTGQNFLVDLWLFLLRNVTLGNLMQIFVGQPGPLIGLRRPLREFLEHSFPDSTQSSLQEQVVDQVVTRSRSYLQILDIPDEQTTGRRIDIPATIEALLRKFCLEFLKLLFNNDLDDTTFAQEAVTLAKKLEDQSSAVLQHILQGGQTTLETIASRFVNQLTEGVPPLFQQMLLGVLSTRIRAYATRTSGMSRVEITSLLVYKDEPSAPPAEPESQAAATAPVNEIPIKQEQAQAQAQALPPQPKPVKVKEEKADFKPEPMETDLQLDSKVKEETMDLAIGEDIPETFPGAENIPAEWVPIIARDSVRQRKQAQMQALQGNAIPFSDAYLNCLPSKRRKLIEQQKPQLLVQPTPANNTVIGASVERLVRDGVARSQLDEAEGAARAVATAPAVRSAFGQAIKECLQPARLRTPDFPNSRRFPNASNYFADADKASSSSSSDGASK